MLGSMRDYLQIRLDHLVVCRTILKTAPELFLKQLLIDSAYGVGLNAKIYTRIPKTSAASDLVDAPSSYN